MSASKDHHVVPLKTYIIIFSALVFLTLVTVWTAGMDFGKLNMVVAMFIATLKASLVLLYFMHLKYDGWINRVIFATGFFFLLVFLGLSLMDILTRLDYAPK